MIKEKSERICIDLDSEYWKENGDKMFTLDEEEETKVNKFENLLAQSRVNFNNELNINPSLQNQALSAKNLDENNLQTLKIKGSQKTREKVEFPNQNAPQIISYELMKYINEIRAMKSPIQDSNRNHRDEIKRLKNQDKAIKEDFNKRNITNNTNSITGNNNSKFQLNNAKKSTEKIFRELNECSFIPKTNKKELNSKLSLLKAHNNPYRNAQKTLTNIEQTLLRIPSPKKFIPLKKSINILETRKNRIRRPSEETHLMNSNLSVIIEKKDLNEKKKFIKKAMDCEIQKELNTKRTSVSFSKKCLGSTNRIDHENKTIDILNRSKSLNKNIKKEMIPNLINIQKKKNSEFSNKFFNREYDHILMNCKIFKEKVTFFDFQEILKSFSLINNKNSTNREKQLSEDLWYYLDNENKNEVTVKNVKTLIGVLLSFENSSKNEQQNRRNVSNNISIQKDIYEHSNQSDNNRKGIFDSQGDLLITNYEKSYLRSQYKELFFNRLSLKKGKELNKPSEKINIINNSIPENSKKLIEITENKPSIIVKAKNPPITKCKSSQSSTRYKNQLEDKNRFNKTFIKNISLSFKSVKFESEKRRKSSLKKQIISKLSIPKIKNPLSNSDVLDFKKNILDCSFSPKISQKQSINKSNQNQIKNIAKEIERMGRGRSMKRDKNEELLFTKKGSTSIRLPNEIKNNKQGFDSYKSKL